MTYVNDGDVVFISTHEGFKRCVVLCAAGHDCRIQRDEDGKTFWVKTASLFSEKAVAAEAARRLGAT